MAIANQERQSPTAAEEKNYSLFADDALYRAQQAIGLIPRHGGFGLGRRIAIAVAITWLPLIPVFAMQIPLKEIAKMLLAPLIGI